MSIDRLAATAADARRIWVVDDDRSVRFVLATALRDAGFTVHTVEIDEIEMLLSSGRVGPLLGFRLNVGNELGMLSVSADAEMIDDYVRYMLLLRASFRF